MNVYRHKDGDESSLIYNSVVTMMEYDSLHVLIGTGMGLQMYDYATDSFTKIPLINGRGDTILARVPYLCRLEDGRVDVCASGFGNFIINGQQSTSKGQDLKKMSAVWTEEFVPTSGDLLQMLIDSHHKMWILTREKGLYYVEGDASQKHKDKHTFINVEGTKGALMMTEGMYGIYAATSEGDFMKIQGGKAEKIHIPTFISNVNSDKKGHIYICTDGNGLLVYNENDGSISPSMVRTNDFDLTFSNVKDAITDHEGNLWIGIYWKGVVVSPSTSSSFNYIGRRSAVKNTLGTNCITAICGAKDGGVWVATDHCGLYKMKSDGISSTHYEPENTPGIPSTITAIHEDEYGTIWMGSSIGGLSKGVGNKFSDSGLGIERIYSIVEDNHQTLWMATMGMGIYSYNLVTHETNHYSGLVNGQENYPFNLMSNFWVYTLCIDGNMLYAGTADGLEVFRIENGMLKKLGRHFVRHSINSIKVLDHTLWVGTSLGLIRAKISKDGKCQKSKTYNENDGLSNNMVNAIEFSSGPEKMVWLSTDNGLCCFNPKTEVFANYYKTDGLQGNEFSRVSANVAGNLYFGGINGLTYFSNNETGKTNQQNDFEELRIVDIYVQGKAIRANDKSGSYTMFDGWISNAERIDLCNEDNSFIVELSTMSFDSHHLQYQYKINNDEWISAPEDQNRIAFNNLPAGTYKISFRLSEDVETSITVVIHPAWYASWWAWILYILIACGIIFYLWRIYKERISTKRILENHRQSQMMSEMRTKFFMDISHEIRTPMTLILGPLQKLKEIVKHSEEEGNKDIEQGVAQTFEKNLNLISQNADRIMTLVNQLMDVRKIEKGQFPLHYSKIELVGFLQNLYNLFSANARDRNIGFDFIHDVPHLFACVDSQNLDKIVMNLLSNAFKFTPKDGKITLKLESSILNTQDSEEPSFIISVTDNGIGIPDEQKKHVFDRFFSSSNGTGIGLNLSYMLAQLHEGELTVCDNPNEKGSRFVLTMPQALYLQEEKDENNDKSDNKAQNEDYDDTIAEELVIVEDDEDIRKYMCEELSQTYSTIHQFGNGQEAWNYLVTNSQKVSLVVSDIMMPVMNGTDLCKKIKQNFNTNHIPVILLTAKVSDQEQIEGLNAGADEYVTKPFSIEVLASRISNLLNSRKLLQSKYQNMAQEKAKIENVELTSPDEQLMERVMKVINNNIANPDLSVEMIADMVGVSRVHFHRRIKDITNLTPRDLLKGIRLRQAAKLLGEKHLDITAVSDATGFKSVSTFSTAFKHAYGMSPTEFRSQ